MTRSPTRSSTSPPTAQPQSRPVSSSTRPTLNFNGSDSFTYKANDGTADSNVANVAVTVNAVNDAPVCANVSITTDEDTAGTTAPDCSDVDGDTLTYAIVDQPANGTAAVTAGQLEYTPNLNFNGSDSFTYKANDGTADSNVANVARHRQRRSTTRRWRTTTRTRSTRTPRSTSPRPECSTATPTSRTTR